MLLLTAIPVHATNNALPAGTRVDISFSPSHIPLGYYSTLTIEVSVDHDLYVLVSISFEDWLRWQTSDVKLGDFLNGGVVFKSDNQVLNNNYLQLALVVPKGDSRVVQVPVYPTRAGVFYLHEVQVVTLPLVNGNYVLSQDGNFILGLTISMMQFDSHLEVYDPTLRQISDTQQQSLENEQALASQLSNITTDLGLLTSLVNIGFQGVNEQHNQLMGLFERQTGALLYQMQLLVRVLWILVGAIVALGVYLIWREVVTYRRAKTRT